MAKLYFRYGAMGSSKTANALMVQYNYAEKNKRAILLKPEMETRDGECTVKSRIGLMAECMTVEDFLAYVDKYWINKETGFFSKIPLYYKIGFPENLSAILVDEVQFLSEEQIGKLAYIVDAYNISIICYGLKTDFTGKLFQGSKRLFELANEVEEIPTICWCGKKAQFNARMKDDKIVRFGEQIEMGGSDVYISLCRKHYMEGQIKEN